MATVADSTVFAWLLNPLMPTAQPRALCRAGFCFHPLRQHLMGGFNLALAVAQPAERVAALRFLQKMLHHPPKPLASGYFWQAIDRFHVPLP